MAIFLLKPNKNKDILPSSRISALGQIGRIALLHSVNRIFYLKKRRLIMAVKPTKAAKPFVWVKDKKGNQYICPLDALKDPKKATQKELKSCIDDAKMGVNIGD
jgi:hypothetical protein